MRRQFRHISSPDTLPSKYQLNGNMLIVNSCAFCGVKSIVPLVISMTLNKTESLRLYSNNDISSQSQVNIMPKRKRDRISDPAKNKQFLPTCIIRVTSLSDHGRFITRSQVSDTLQQICEIRNIRFRQSIDSSWSILTKRRQLVFSGGLHSGGSWGLGALGPAILWGPLQW